MRWGQLLAAAFAISFATTGDATRGEEAPADATSTESTPVEEIPIEDYDRDHWSFQPLRQPKLPEVDAKLWPQSAVDYFILQKLEGRQLHPLPTANRAVLLRRLKFDLLGLPPTPLEIADFEEDASPDAYQRRVDHFLSSPAYGERWAQHWLDLARFAETDGFEHDKVRLEAWKYRQWVIDALNEDMPYDEFVRLQLTGDQTGRAEDAIATVFCVAGPDMPDINEQDLRRHDKLNEIASTVGATLLGLQMHCAQCHDHKYDPISQADFYRLRGIFEGAVPVMQRDQPVDRLSSSPSGIRPRIYYRGELQNRGPAVLPRPPRIASTDESLKSFDTLDPRSAFAEWLFDASNPLTARVIANRVWQHHFGRSLSGNPSDFGLVASEPSHPDLLDWLASELIRRRWSLKQLHRVIVTSSTYQQASFAAADDPATQQRLELARASDPENEWYSRFPRKRLEGEIIRDTLLAVSGQLNRAYGGPSVMPPLPPELTETLLRGQWETSSQQADHVRRSIYVFARRNLRYPIFDVFDRPDAGASCARRDRSTTAIQSLQMLNSELALQAATALRNRLLPEADSGDSADAGGDWDGILRQLFLVCLARPPSAEEVHHFSEFPRTSSLSPRDSLLAICLAVLNTSEFIYID